MSDIYENSLIPLIQQRKYIKPAESYFDTLLMNVYERSIKDDGYVIKGNKSGIVYNNKKIYMLCQPTDVVGYTNLSKVPFYIGIYSEKNNMYIISHNGVPTFTYFNEDNTELKTVDFSHVLGEFSNWSSIVTFKDKIICLDGRRNNLLIISNDVKTAKNIKLPCYGIFDKWEVLTVFDDLISISNGLVDYNNKVLVTDSEFETWYNVKPKKDASEIIISDKGYITRAISPTRCIIDQVKILKE